ncbi:superoxide dismutase [Phenylobacterium sp.]|uniref:superoxide dismutase n=1 Tax=Phenylobacterium sp. TaxID=1871053 RepID=UPI00286E86B0|nr:superoxide dismutase [Phenylobacterium sp.]
MFELPPLPYDHAALEPVISRATMNVHHGKHHKKYIETLNTLLARAGRTPDSLEEVVRKAAGDDAATKLFNNAAQAWNHTFFWTAMSARRQAPEGVLIQAIARDFGGLEALKAAFVKEGNGHFGSGWVWLAAEGETLKLLSTHDAEDLLIHRGLTPLLVCDVWEHAYYLDHQNDREGFLNAWFDSLPNWSFAERQYAASRGEGQAWSHPAPVKPATGTAELEARSS